MLVTELGTVICFNDLQKEKALWSILVTEFGMVI